MFTTVIQNGKSTYMKETSGLASLSIVFLLNENHNFSVVSLYLQSGERSGSVVKCLTGDREAAGSSVTGVTALWSLSKIN